MWYMYIYICILYHILFILSSVNGNLCCLHALGIVESAAKNTGVQISLQDSDFISFRSDKFPEVKLLDHRVIQFLIF